MRTAFTEEQFTKTPVYLHLKIRFGSVIFAPPFVKGGLSEKLIMYEISGHEEMSGGGRWVGNSLKGLYGCSVETQN